MVKRLPDPYETDTSTVGVRIRQIRAYRRKSLRVIAGLAGLSKSRLSEIERGTLPIDSIRQLVAIANALEVAPSELMRLPVPAPGNGHTDLTTQEVRLALDAVETGHPGGATLPMHVLQQRIMHVHHSLRWCHFNDVTTTLPALIKDAHTTLNNTTTPTEALQLVVYLHVHITRIWLAQAAAGVDLQNRIGFLTLRLAQQNQDPNLLAMARFALIDILGGDGAFDLAVAEWNRIEIPAVTKDTAGMVAALLVARSFLAVVKDDPGGVEAPIAEATSITSRYGEIGEADPTGFGWGPTDVAFRRARIAIEAGDPDTAIAVAESLGNQPNPFPGSRVYHLVNYGRALSGVRGRAVDAIRVFREAEALNPHRVQRDPFVRDALSGLVQRAKRDAVGLELRGMAYRSGVTV